MSVNHIKVYGWEVSPFTAKVLSYLTYKQLNPKSIPPNLFQLNFKIKKDVGQIIMPVVYDDEHILQDSSAIIDFYESQYASKSITPEAPLQIMASYLLELLGDEWLPLAALHYRWHYPQNRDFIFSEFGRNALPKFPKPTQTWLAKKLGGKMAGYLPILGISSSMQQPLEANTHNILHHLNQHLSLHPFLFGSRPSLADFSLYGPIYAHLYRDPFPDKLLSPYPDIIHWLKKLNGPINKVNGQWMKQSGLPITLMPLLQTWAQTHVPLIKASIESFSNWCEHHPNDNKLPRHFGNTQLAINGATSKRLNLSYGLWMWQRIQKVYQRFEDHELGPIDALLNQLGILTLIQTPLAKPIELKQCRLHVAP